MRKGFIMELWKRALSFLAGVSRTRLCDREQISLGGRTAASGSRRQGTRARSSKVP